MQLIRAMAIAAFLSLAGGAQAGDLVSRAEQFLGGNPTGWRHNWCMEFVNRVLRMEGLAGTGSANAGSLLRFPRTGPHRGALVAISWRGHRIDHAGIVDFVDSSGRVHIVSGNTHRHVVGLGVISPRNVVAYVEPRAGFGAELVPWPIHGHAHRWHGPRHHRRRA